MTTRSRNGTSSRTSVIAIAVISLIVRFAFAGTTGPLAAPQPVPQKIPLTNSLPSQITTTDGKVYNEVKLLQIEPDGLLVQYRPAAGGIGLANLKFAKLPGSLQKQFGYNPLKATAFEQEQARAMAELSQKMRQEEKARSAELNDLSLRPNLAGAVSVNSSPPAVTHTYFAPGQKPIVVGEHAAVTAHHYTCGAVFTFHAQQNTTGGPIRLYVESVRIKLGLSVNIIEPEHPYDFLSRHEEGHRRLYEYFYRFAPQIADTIGKAMVGQEFNSSATDIETAKTEARPIAENMFRMQYLARIESVARSANVYYDQLTDPGRKHIDVDRAIQKAIAKYGNQINLQPQIPNNPLPLPGNHAAMPPRFQAFPSPPN